MKVREHAKQLPKELIKDITLKSAERSLLSTHDVKCYNKVVTEVANKI